MADRSREQHPRALLLYPGGLFHRNQELPGMRLRAAVIALLCLVLAGCADTPQTAARCYQWDPVESAVASAIPWAPKQPPGCGG